MYQILEYMNGKMHETKYTELSMSVYWTLYKLYYKITELYSMYTVMRKKCTELYTNMRTRLMNCLYTRGIICTQNWYKKTEVVTSMITNVLRYIQEQ
jgi:hypothetical protein